MTTDYFHGCNTEPEIKSRYRELCKQHHPDLGGDEETMKAVNLAYEQCLRGEYRKTMPETEAEEAVEMEREVAAKLAEIIRIQGIIIEIVGRWVWVTGNTFPVRQNLKAAGFWFASKKRAWYWHKAEDSVARASKLSLDEIKTKYGARIIPGQTGACLGA